jgi:hypothetical protein
MIIRRSDACQPKKLFLFSCLVSVLSIDMSFQTLSLLVTNGVSLIGSIQSASWGCRRYWRHVMLGMTVIISSTRSCQVRCVSLDVATILRIVTRHDREGPEAWTYARHERDLLTREGFAPKVWSEI